MARRKGNTVTQIHAPWWDASEMVVVRERVTHGDQKRIYANLMSGRVNSATKNMEMQFQLSEVQGAMLKVMIVDWTLIDEQGNRLAFTEAAIDELAAEDVEFIADEIGRRNPTMTPEERAAFFKQAETSSQAKS